MTTIARRFRAWLSNRMLFTPQQRPGTDLVRYAGPRLACGCPQRHIWLFDGGRHPWYCPDNGKFEPYAIDFAGYRAPGPHNVDGVVMPWASIGANCLSKRWGDISELGDGACIARRYEDTGHFAMASRRGGGWHWAIFDVAGATAKPAVLAEGDVDEGALVEGVDGAFVKGVAAVLVEVYRRETEYELAA